MTADAKWRWYVGAKWMERYWGGRAIVCRMVENFTAETEIMKLAQLGYDDRKRVVVPLIRLVAQN